MTKNDSNREQSRLPALRMEVMSDVFAVVMWLLMLAHQAGRQWPATPLAAMRLRVHPRQHSVEVSIGHVVPARQILVRQRPAVVKIVPGARSTAFYHPEQLIVGIWTKQAAHSW